MKKLIVLMILLLGKQAYAQLYFPPVAGNTWETVDPIQLGWCTDRLDTLYSLLENRGTKGFIILKDGRIAVERYFGTFTMDSAWYWASAAKSLTAFLVGQAAQKELLHINDSVSRYLGASWSSCTPEQEKLITVKHQLSMTTGLDYNVPDADCTDPQCLKYKADAGSFWYYHNAPYHLVHDVVAAAAGKTWQQFTNQELGFKTGISGLWLDHVFYSKPRSMARFGLLMLNKGVWGTDTLLRDSAYYRQMITTSQPHNEAYGYLWWLNGKSTFKLPGTTFTFNGKLIPPAPDDLYAALGKNDQKLYVWPSKKIVVIRMGEAADGNNPVPITFDTILWNELNRLMCSEYTGLTNNYQNEGLIVWPNPAKKEINFTLQKQHNGIEVSLFNDQGQIVYGQKIEYPLYENKIDISRLRHGLYTLRIISGNEVLVKKLIVE